jgi:hypothetical protein
VSGKNTAPSARQPKVRRLVDRVLGDERVFLFGAATAEPDREGLELILPTQNEAAARRFLSQGYGRVLLGEVALRDSAAVARLAREYGPERVGIYALARRMEVSWTLDSVSNADFKVMRPSMCEPCWEIVRADGSRTGAIAGWWIGEMLKQDASSALLRVDIGDDTDLNLCATLVEQFGERLWIGPLDDADPRLGDWIAYGKATQLALPTGVECAGVPPPLARSATNDASASMEP